MIPLLTLLTAPGTPGTALAQDNPALRSDGPAVGQPAPDFTLARLGSEGTVTLSELSGDRPTVLVFGSYT